MAKMKYVRIKDEVTWQQFGAPDPGFFDRHIKDAWLAVIGTGTWYYRVQDPTDPDSEFILPKEIFVNGTSHDDIQQAS